jgi:hypothetical protein
VSNGAACPALGHELVPNGKKSKGLPPFLDTPRPLPYTLIRID